MKNYYLLAFAIIIFILQSCTDNNKEKSKETVINEKLVSDSIPASEKSSHADSVDTFEFDTTVICSFRQGHNDDYNCASIATIKCAIATFTPDSVVHKIKESNNSFLVVLRNGDTLVLEKSELKIATEDCGFLFQRNKQIFDKAIFLYAIMGKKATIETIKNPKYGYDRDFKKSLTILHNGATTTDLPELLGLDYAHVRYRNRKNINDFVFFNGYHAVFGSDGYYDDYGKPKKLTLYFQGHSTLNAFKSLEKNLIVLTDMH